MVQKNTPWRTNAMNADDKQKGWSGENQSQEQRELLEKNPPERYQDKGKFNLNRPSDNLEKDGSGQRQWPQDKQSHAEKDLAQRRSGNRHQ